MSKKFWVSAVVVFVFLTLWGWVYHGWLMKGLYVETAAFWRPVEEMRQLLWWVYLGNALFAWLFCWIWPKGVEAGKGMVGQGLRYGLLVGLILYLPMTVSHYAYLPWPVKLSVWWLVGGLVETVIAGGLVGKVYQKIA